MRSPASPGSTPVFFLPKEDGAVRSGLTVSRRPPLSPTRRRRTAGRVQAIKGFDRSRPLAIAEEKSETDVLQNILKTVHNPGQKQKYSERAEKPKSLLSGKDFGNGLSGKIQPADAQKSLAAHGLEPSNDKIATLGKGISLRKEKNGALSKSKPADVAGGDWLGALIGGDVGSGRVRLASRPGLPGPAYFSPSLFRGNGLFFGGSTASHSLLLHKMPYAPPRVPMGMHRGLFPRSMVLSAACAKTFFESLLPALFFRASHQMALHSSILLFAPNRELFFPRRSGKKHARSQ